MLKCIYCEREFKNAGARGKHEKSCKNRPDYVEPQKLQKMYNIPQEYKCCFCSKICHSLNSLKQHEIRCSLNPDRISVYKDGFNKNTKGIVKCINTGKICITNGINNSYIYPDEDMPEGWSIGSHTKGRSGYFSGKKHTDISKQIIGKKVSQTRRRLIADGKITPVTSHRYVNSYIQYADGHRRFLRSSYELIVAVFLDLCGISFNYETVRAPYYDDSGKLHSFIGDFVVNNIVLEIKGDYDLSKLERETAAFKNIGYELRVIHEQEVLNIKNLLQEIMDIKGILNVAKECSKCRNYYTYYLNY